MIALLLALQGLIAKYSDGERTVEGVAPTPNFTLAADESIHPLLAPKFTAEWTGVLKVMRAGRYTFYGATVQIDGLPELAAGEHAIKIAFSKDGEARLRLEWESDHFKREPVPASAFTHRGEVKPDAYDRGRDHIERHGCVACHVGATPTSNLTHVGSRVQAGWLASFLPKHSKHADADVTAYIVSLKNPRDKVKPMPSDAFRRKAGRDLFERLGCAACHEKVEGMGAKYDAGHLAEYLVDPLKVNRRTPHMFLTRDEAAFIAEYLTADGKPEVALIVGDALKGRETVARKCLQCHTIDGVESAFEVKAITSFDKPCPEAEVTADVGVAWTARSKAPVYEFHRTLKRLQCFSCHEAAGLTELPPPLTGAGDKLRESWLRQVLVRRKRVRPWMGLRMPHFGEAVEPLVKGFGAASGAPAGDGEKAAPTLEQIREGVKLIGKGELGCIQCHDFRGHVSIGTRGPDMTEMAARMRPEWFKRWMRDPARIQAGTSMPNYFEGKADADKTIDLVWACLSAGAQMPLPAGLADQAAYLLLVKDEPVIVRSMMPGASSRCISVGFPGFLSFCFDAEACKTVYAWSGDFLDMAPVWAGRGGEPARLLGKKTWTAPEGFPIVIDGKKPEWRFKRYDVEKGIPTFVYEVNGVEVRERIKAGMERSFEIATDLPITFEGKAVQKKFTVKIP